MVTSSDDEDAGGGGPAGAGRGRGRGGNVNNGSGSSSSNNSGPPDRFYSSNPYPTQPSQVLSPRSRRPAGLALQPTLTTSPRSPAPTQAPAPAPAPAPAAASATVSATAASSTPSSPFLAFDLTAFDTDPTTLKPTASTPSPPRLSPPIRRNVATASSSRDVASLPTAPDRRSPAAPGPSAARFPVDSSSPPGNRARSNVNDPTSPTISTASSASSETLQGRRHLDRSQRSSYVSPLPRSPAKSQQSFTPPVPPPKDVPTIRSVSAQSIPGQATIEPSEFGTATIQYPVVKAPTSISSWADSIITIPKKRRTPPSQPTPDRFSAEPLRLNPVTPPPEARLQPRTPPSRYQAGRKDIGDGFSVPQRYTPSSSMLAEASSASPPSDPATSSARYKGKAPVRNWSYRDPLAPDSDKPKGKRKGGLRRDRDSAVPLPLRLRGPPSPESPYPTVSQFVKDIASQSPPPRDARSVRDRTEGVKRSYYGHGASEGAPGSSTEEPTDHSDVPTSPVDDNMPLGIFRSAKAKRRSQGPLQIYSESEDPDAIMPAPLTDVPTTAAASIEPLERRAAGIRYSEPAWEPRLQTDRRVTMVSFWEAPRVEPGFDEAVCGPRNLQLYTFCIGFLIPVAWWIGSFLPLPPKPWADDDDDGEKAGGVRARRSRFESSLAKHCDPVDESRYENARWWRNVNRVMSIVGLLLAGAIIAMAVVASRTRSS
ncbi:MAG: hypothetical protein M1814_000656 [Vezdaea aestivalis]|nr:MAG: hypothetical protein M1814_000656 [Vezdaea aestivalis]